MLTVDTMNRITAEVSLVGLKIYIAGFEDGTICAETLVKLIEDNIAWLKRDIEKNKSVR